MNKLLCLFGHHKFDDVWDFKDGSQLVVCPGCRQFGKYTYHSYAILNFIKLSGKKVNHTHVVKIKEETSQGFLIDTRKCMVGRNWTRLQKMLGSNPYASGII